MRLVRNAVDAADSIPAGREDEIRRRLAPNGELLIGVFGRLSPEKGQTLLVPSFAAVRSLLPPCRLLFVGDGPLKDQLGEMVRSFGLGDCAIFEGYQSAMRDYYRAVDLLVLPSLREGLPNVVLEAMVYDLPVLASTVGGVPELIRDGETGWLYEPGNPEELQRALRRVLIDERGRWDQVAAAARKALSPKYCPRERSRKFLALYKELLEKQGLPLESQYQSAAEW